MDKVYIVLPALNEVSSIKKVIEEVHSTLAPNTKFGWKIVVADSGSTDGTVELCIREGVEVIPGPKGKGNNIKNCFNVIRERNDAAWVVMLDSDHTYPAEYINPMLTILQSNSYDIIVGKRDTIQKNAMSKSHRFGNTILTLLANTLYPDTYTPDLCTGMWAFNKKALNSIVITAPRFQLEANLFCECSRLKLRLGYVPIYYRARGGSTPHLKMKDGLQIGWWVVKERIKRWK